MIQHGNILLNRDNLFVERFVEALLATDYGGYPMDESAEPVKRRRMLLSNVDGSNFFR